MRYKVIYDQLMLKAQCRGSVPGYFEKHHIVPRCLGGSNDKSNLVKLTAKEHFIAHMLLAKAFPENNKLVFAWSRMTHSGGLHQARYKVTSRTFETLKLSMSKALSVLHSTRVRSEKEKENQRNAAREANTNKVATEETRKKQSIAQQKRFADPNCPKPNVSHEERKRRSEAAKKHNAERVITDKDRAAMSAAQRNRSEESYNFMKPTANKNGWKILTPDGFKPFDGVAYSGIVYALEIAFTGGSITVSKKHIFFTPTGERVASELSVGDELHTGIFITSIKETDKKVALYDILEVEGHAYVSNNVISHNCMRVTETDIQVIPELTKTRAESILLKDTTYKHDPLFMYYQKYIVVDWGGRDMTAILFAHYNYQAMKLIVEADLTLVGKDVSPGRIATAIKEMRDDLWPPNVQVGRGHGSNILYYCDNNNVIVTNTMIEDHQLPFVATTKSGLKDQMVKKVRDWVYDDRIRFAPRAQTALNSAMSAVWSKARDKFAQSKRYGHYDHTASLVYLVRNCNVTFEAVPDNPDYNANTHFRIKKQTEEQRAQKRQVAAIFKRR